MRTNNILLIDNDVLVYVLDYLHASEPRHARIFIGHLATRYYQIWVPSTVYDEFLRKIEDKKRKKIIDRFMDIFQALIFCPITVGRNEISLLTKGEYENEGEADAILQGRKAMNHLEYGKSNYFFLTNDKGAINLAENMGVDVIPYKSLKGEFLEMGINLPAV